MNAVRRGTVTIILLVATQFVLAQSEEIGNFCVQDYQPAFVCTANDVSFEALYPTVIEDCQTRIVGQARVQLGMHLGAPLADRWDVGLFVGLGSGADDARSGDSCLHGFLGGALTSSPSYTDVEPGGPNGVQEIVDGPWLDSDLDSCGDIRANSEVFINSPTVVDVPCVDRDGDGYADLHVCVSWDSNTGTTCGGISGAFPGTNSKCGCRVLSLGIWPAQRGTGVLVDPGGDAVDRVGDPDTDLVSASVVIEGATVIFTVGFEASSFEPATSHAIFNMDLDNDPSTGYPGMTSNSYDHELLGCEAMLNVGTEALDAVLSTYSGGSWSHSLVGRPTSESSGFSIAVPRASLAAESGCFSFKVSAFNTFSQPPGNSATDLMSNQGGVVGYACAPVFADGFESGDTLTWSSTVPFP